MTNKIFFLLILLNGICFSIKSQSIIITVEKVDIDIIKLNPLHGISTWDLSKPNITTFIEIYNKSSDTLKIDSLLINSYLHVPINNRTHKIPFNFLANEDVISSQSLMPNSSVSLAIEWTIDRNIINRVKRKKLIVFFLNSYLLVNVINESIISSSPRKIIIKSDTTKH